jgi:serine/threonine-protein kinase
VGSGEFRYRLGVLIGASATCEVYAATAIDARQREREVAFKRLRAELRRDEAAVEELLSEAWLVAQLDVPGVVRVYDAGFFEGAPFLAMERVHGLNLGALLDLVPGRRLPATCALFVAERVATTLDAVHSARGADGRPLRIVHRDINPTNVLITETADVELTDFGIARAYGRRRHTTPGAARGTLPYMAPEQLRLEELDARTDVFGLGCVLREMLLGDRRLDSTSVRDDVVAGIDLTASAVPAPIQAIVEKATRARREDRFASGAEMAAALREQLEGDPKEALRELVRDVEKTESMTFGTMSVEIDENGEPSVTAPLAPRPVPPHRTPSRPRQPGPMILIGIAVASAIAIYFLLSALG